MKIEKIIWVDAHFDNRWHKIADLDLCAPRTVTIGYVVKETSEILCVSSTINCFDNTYSNILYIPKCCVNARIILGD